MFAKFKQKLDAIKPELSALADTVVPRTPPTGSAPAGSSGMLGSLAGSPSPAPAVVATTPDVLAAVSPLDSPALQRLARGPRTTESYQHPLEVLAASQLARRNQALWSTLRENNAALAAKAADADHNVSQAAAFCDEQYRSWASLQAEMALLPRLKESIQSISGTLERLCGEIVLLETFLDGEIEAKMEDEAAAWRATARRETESYYLKRSAELQRARAVAYSRHMEKMAEKQRELDRQMQADLASFREQQKGTRTSSNASKPATPGLQSIGPVAGAKEIDELEGFLGDPVTPAESPRHANLDAAPGADDKEEEEDGGGQEEEAPEILTTEEEPPAAAEEESKET